LHPHQQGSSTVNTGKAEKKEVEKLRKNICQIQKAVLSLPTRKGSSSLNYCGWCFEGIKSKIIFKKPCQSEKKLYFCTRFENESSLSAKKQKMTRS
jgi:hypothetical protein